jgi:hypothetical protein
MLCIQHFTIVGVSSEPAGRFDSDGLISHAQGRYIRLAAV